MGGSIGRRESVWRARDAVAQRDHAGRNCQWRWPPREPGGGPASQKDEIPLDASCPGRSGWINAYGENCRCGTGACVPAWPQCQGTRTRRRGHRPRGEPAAQAGRGGRGAVVPAHRGRLLPASPRRWPAGRSRRQPRSQGIEPRRDPRRCLGVVAGQRRAILRQASAPGAAGAPPSLPKPPESLRWYAMLLVFAAAVGESILASRYLGTQREESWRLAPRLAASSMALRGDGAPGAFFEAITLELFAAAAGAGIVAADLGGGAADRPSRMDCAELCTVFGDGAAGSGCAYAPPGICGEESWGGSSDSKAIAPGAAAIRVGERSRTDGDCCSAGGAIARARMDWAAFRRTPAGVSCSVMRARMVWTAAGASRSASSRQRRALASRARVRARRTCGWEFDPVVHGIAVDVGGPGGLGDGGTGGYQRQHLFLKQGERGEGRHKRSWLQGSTTAGWSPQSVGQLVEGKRKKGGRSWGNGIGGGLAGGQIGGRGKRPCTG